MSERPWRWSLTRSDSFPGAVVLLVEETVTPEGELRRGLLAPVNSRHEARALLPVLADAFCRRIARTWAPVVTYDPAESPGLPQPMPESP